MLHLQKTLNPSLYDQRKVLFRGQRNSFETFKSNTLSVSYLSKKPGLQWFYGTSWPSWSTVFLKSIPYVLRNWWQRIVYSFFSNLVRWRRLPKDRRRKRERREGGGSGGCLSWIVWNSFGWMRSPWFMTPRQRSWCSYTLIWNFGTEDITRKKKRRRGLVKTKPPPGHSILLFF